MSGLLRRPQCLVAGEDLPFELVEIAAGLEADLDELLSRLLEGSQRVGLTAGSVEGDRQPCPQAFAQRVICRQLGERCDGLVGSVGSQIDVGAQLDGRETLGLEAGRLTLREVVVCEISEGRTTPESQRLGNESVGFGLVAGGECGAGGGQKLAECVQVGRDQFLVEAVAGSDRLDGEVGEGLAQLGDLMLQSVSWVGRKSILPGGVDQLVDGHDPAQLKGQKCEDRALLGAAEGQLRAVYPHRQRAE